MAHCQGPVRDVHFFRVYMVVGDFAPPLMCLRTVDVFVHLFV